MIGYVPKAGFLKWMRPHVFPWKKMGQAGAKAMLVSSNMPTYTTSQIAADCRRCRSYMLHDFAWYGCRGRDAESPEVDAGTTTRSTAAKEEEWALDKEAFAVDTTDRYHSRMSIKSLVVAGVGTKMVLLVRAHDKDVLMRGEADRIEEEQGHARTVLCRQEYITLQCHISE